LIAYHRAKCARHDNEGQEIGSDFTPSTVKMTLQYAVKLFGVPITFADPASTGIAGDGNGRANGQLSLETGLVIAGALADWDNVLGDLLAKVATALGAERCGDC
jgi:hypothetical protein